MAEIFRWADAQGSEDWEEEGGCGDEGNNCMISTRQSSLPSLLVIRDGARSSWWKDCSYPVSYSGIKLS